MSNDEMKPKRFLKLQNGRNRMRFIESAIASGCQVVVSTAMRCTYYKSIAYFKMDKSGSVYVARGRKWDCIDFCKVGKY